MSNEVYDNIVDTYWIFSKETSFLYQKDVAIQLPSMTNFIENGTKQESKDAMFQSLVTQTKKCEKLFATLATIRERYNIPRDENIKRLLTRKHSKEQNSRFLWKMVGRNRNRTTKKEWWWKSQLFCYGSNEETFSWITNCKEMGSTKNDKRGIWWKISKMLFSPKSRWKIGINQQWIKLFHNWSIRAPSPLSKTNCIVFKNKQSALFIKLSNDTLERKRMK